MSDKLSFLYKNHIRDKATFNAVFSSRKRINASVGVLRFVRNELGYSRLGIIVSKRNVRLAVTRNKLRRMIKEQFRLHQVKNSGYDVVFVVYKQANDASSHEFHQCIRHLFNVLVKRVERS